jgi:hypothetical protein
MAIKGGVHTFFQKRRSCLKVLGAKRVTGSKVHIEDSILGTTIQNLFSHGFEWSISDSPIFCSITL